MQSGVVEVGRADESGGCGGGVGKADEGGVRVVGVGRADEGVWGERGSVGRMREYGGGG